MDCTGVDSGPGCLCRFFLDIASDCPASDSVNHSLSFISDGNVLALHRLLWNNQEKIGQYLSSNRSDICSLPGPLPALSRVLFLLCDVCIKAVVCVFALFFFMF